MPTTSAPCARPISAAARIAAFIPGASPPLVRIPIRLMMAMVRESTHGGLRKSVTDRDERVGIATDSAKLGGCDSHREGGAGHHRHARSLGGQERGGPANGRAARRCV